MDEIRDVFFAINTGVRESRCAVLGHRPVSFHHLNYRIMTRWNNIFENLLRQTSFTADGIDFIFQINDLSGLVLF